MIKYMKIENIFPTQPKEIEQKIKLSFQIKIGWLLGIL